MWRGIALAATATAMAVAATAAEAQVPGRVRLSGYVRSAESGEVVRGATILSEQGPRTESNQDGFYVLTLPAGRHVIRVRALGFRPTTDTLDLGASAARDVRLVPLALTLQEIAVTAAPDTQDIDLTLTQMSVSRLDARDIRLAPAVLGEVDPIRTLTLLPGVTTQSDGSTGISVRGGTPDQNLILLDESVIYNPAHVFGFFSVFNADAIDDVTLYKGAIPARYGGRLSSVLDIRQRDGNRERLEGAASIGLISSRASIEGPLPGEAGSFLLAGRRTYADLFLRLSSDPNINQNTAYFYDFNAKATMRLGTSGSLLVAGYFGRDRFAVRDRLESGWGNAAGTLRWTQSFGSRLFSKVTLSASDYDYSLGIRSIGRDFDWLATIRSGQLSVVESFYVDNANVIEFGGELTRHAMDPGVVRPFGDSPVQRLELERRFGWAPAAHVSHEVDLSPAVSVRYGLRWAGFARVGSGTVFEYADGRPVVYNAGLDRYERAVPIDSTAFGPGERITSAGGLEPRASLRWQLTAGAALKASYARTRQFLHLISNTNSPTPLDLWEPIGPYLGPQRSDQVALGYQGTFGEGMFEVAVEGYYKALDNVPDFVPGAELALNDRLETELLVGRGRAYGLELYLRKRRGKLTGWVSYTLSRSERRLPGIAPGDRGVNRGAWFPSPYDKTHDLAVVAFHPLGETWTVSGTAVVATGLPATFPTSRYQFNGLLLFEYGDRNAARLPMYQRLDLTLTKAWGNKQLQFGVFNVLNRFNAQSIAFRQSEQNALQSEAVQTSIFGLVPSLSFGWRF